jgi:nucleoside-diphosphate kinase
MIEETLIFLKPDSVEKNVGHKIIIRLLATGLTPKYAKFTKLTEEQVREHYSHVSRLDFFEDMVKFITSDYVLIMVLEGADVVNKVRKMIGSTRNAEAGTIRGDFGSDGFRNLIHASGSTQEYEQECEHLLPDYFYTAK